MNKSEIAGRVTDGIEVSRAAAGAAVDVVFRDGRGGFGERRGGPGCRLWNLRDQVPARPHETQPENRGEFGDLRVDHSDVQGRKAVEGFGERRGRGQNRDLVSTDDTW